MKPCAYIQNGCCALMNNLPVEEGKCHCVLYSSELYACEKCGQILAQHPMFTKDDNGNWHCICPNCT